MTAAQQAFILGINGGVRPGYQDISAVLMQNGKVIAAIEEERINRIKHAAGQLPILSVREVLQIAGISITDLNCLAFHGSSWQPEIEQVIQHHFSYYFGYCPPIRRYHHHDCHAASAYYLSGFAEALVLTVDGSGDGISTQVAVGRNNNLEVIARFPRPQSLGMFYSMITQLCGFTRDADEYKLMGLAAYGDPSMVDLNSLLSVTENGYQVDESYMVEILPGQSSPSRYEMLFSKKLEILTGLKRRKEKDIPEAYKHLAAAAQNQLENALTALVKKYVRETGISRVCMAGGVALNCLANQKIEALDEVEALFIQPASSDAGISLGAACLAGVDLGTSSFEKQSHVFWGDEFSDEEIEETIRKCNLPVERLFNPVAAAAEWIAKNKVIGWFQGRMEFGPRALGNRSILANPAAPGIQQQVNQKVKFREGFRPFGASVREEDFAFFFDAPCGEAPYMTKVFTVPEAHRHTLAGVTHADNTCRVQTVNRQQNARYYDLLSACHETLGHGVLLNTSFNLSHEPIVRTPREAIASFYASGLDALIIGSYLLKK